MALKFIALAALASLATAKEQSAFPWPHHWPNPFHRHTVTTTTTTPVPADRQFAGGFADGLGLGDDRSCLTDVRGAAADLEATVKDYLKKDVIDKAKALAKFSEGIKEIVLALGRCEKAAKAGVQYDTLLKDLENPRYYTVHNALVLSLQFAEDHQQLAQFATFWQKGHYHEAGFEVATVLLEVLEHPGLPDSNGTASVNFAAGVAKGFSGAIDNGCFKGVSIEIGAIAGGVSDLLAKAEIPRGLASLFQGVTGLVPLYKECMADKAEIMQLLKDMKDLRHPEQLARDVGHNVLVNGIDVTAYAAAAWLDFKGQSWTRLGEDVGRILSMLFVPSKTVIVV